MSAEPDRRAAFRIDVTAIPPVRVIEGGRPGEPMNGALQDLSVDGARLTLLESGLRRGQRLDLRFELGGDRYHVTAEVRWVRDSRRGNGQYVGVRFDTIPDADRRRLSARYRRLRRSTGLSGTPCATGRTPVGGTQVHAIPPLGP